MSQVVTEIDLIRHGEPVGGRRYRGQIDDPLSDKGWAQMRAAVGDNHPWDIIVTSTLSRCRAFAEEVGQRHGIPVVAEERFKEIGFGVWEGKRGDELREADPDILMRFWCDPLTHRPAGAESLDDFVGRVANAWDEYLLRYRGQRILMVGHAGQMRAVLSYLLEIPLANLFRLQIANAGIIRIDIVEQGGLRLPRLHCINGNL